MFDMKVVTAVFVTLLGIAIGMSQGAFSKGDLTDMSGFLSDLREIPGNLLNVLKGGGSINASISLNLEINRIPEFRKGFSRPLKLLSINYTLPNEKFFVNDAEFSSKDKKISVRAESYRGLVELDEDLTLEGSAESISMGKFYFNSSSFRIRTSKLEPDNLAIKGLEAHTFDFGEVTGSIELPKHISLLNESLRIVGFKGQMFFNFKKKIFKMKGKAAEVFVGGEKSNIQIS